MTTISHSSQVSRAATTSSGTHYGSQGRVGDWDHKLNSLLEDLHGSVIPAGNGQEVGATEYREYRMTQSTRNNDDPPSTTEEKWIEYGTAHQPQPAFLTSLDSRPLGLTQSSSSTTRSILDSSSRNKNSFVRDDSHFGHSHSHNTSSQMEFIDPVNTTVSLRSGQTSPLPPIQNRSSPKVEKKEFYSKASYTTLIKGNQGQPQEFQTFPPITRSDNEYSRETSKYTVQEPPYSPPQKVTKPPETPSNAGLKTPPLVRKILQQSEKSYGSHSHSKTTSGFQPKPVEEPPMTRSVTDFRKETQIQSSYNRDPERIPTYDETYGSRNKNTQYYTSTTTRTETREGHDNIIKRFPSQGTGIDQRSGDPPQRLDDLMATFDESYVETSRIVGDGGGPHKSHPYGPGTRAIEQPQRIVRIDESRNVENEVSRRNVSQNNNIEHTRNVAGPPVFYPAPGDELFAKAKAEELEGMQGKGKAKSKMDRSYKEKEKSKSSHKEKGGGGALPVPVCLPVCCAAPCTIM